MPLKRDSCPSVSYVNSSNPLRNQIDIVVSYEHLYRAACLISKMKLPLIREDDLHWNLRLREKEYLGMGGLVHCNAIPYNPEVPQTITLFHPTRDGLIAMAEALNLPHHRNFET